MKTCTALKAISTFQKQPFIICRSNGRQDTFIPEMSAFISQVIWLNLMRIYGLENVMQTHSCKSFQTGACLPDEIKMKSSLKIQEQLKLPIQKPVVYKENFTALTTLKNTSL